MKRIILLMSLLMSIFLCYPQNPNNKGWIERYQDLTISIGNIKYDTIIKDGKTKVYPYYNILGTGVMFYVKSLLAYPIIVTAQHVLMDEEGKYFDSIKVRFSWEDDKSVYEFLGHNIGLKIQGEGLVYTHPSQKFDLACFPLILKKSDSLNPKRFKQIPYSEFGVGENYSEGNPVYVLGYPGSVGKTYWTRALVRKGVISWVPNEKIGEKKFLIDANVYPGNSGGPVITEIPTIQFRDTTSNDLSKDYRFLGIVIERRFDYNVVSTGKNKIVRDSSGIVITSKNKNITKSPNDFLYSRESIGIAVVEPAENVLVLLQSLDEMIKNIPKK
jgi:hypothetical protein